MKCPHCNGEHPDDFKFCPATGKEIVNELKACSNEACPDFGKHILPQEAKFCPRCGFTLDSYVAETKHPPKIDFNKASCDFNALFNAK